MTKLLTLDLSLGFHASDNIIRLARVFGALSRCRLDLRNYYDGVSNLTSPRLSCLYPNPTLVDRSKTLPALTFRRFLSRAGRPTSALADLGNATTSMYIAILGDTNKEVIVKFTARYNEVASSPARRRRPCPQNYTSVSISLATYTWSLWTMSMGRLFGSSSKTKNLFLPLS